jgi:hypothetical protein
VTRRLTNNRSFAAGRRIKLAWSGDYRPHRLEGSVNALARAGAVATHESRPACWRTVACDSCSTRWTRLVAPTVASQASTSSRWAPTPAARITPLISARAASSSAWPGVNGRPIVGSPAKIR